MTNFHNTIKQKLANYTQVPNEIIYDPNLSAQAKAVFCYLASKPEDWEFYVAEIQKHFSKSITSALKELQDARWIHKQTEPIKGKGKGFNWVWYIASKPFTDSDLEELQKKHNPSANSTISDSNYTSKNTMIVETTVYNNTESITNTETKNSFINKTIKKLSLFADYEYLFDALEQWLQYKQSRRQSYKSDKSILIFCKHLHELSGGNADIAMQVVEQSMANNWSGIFPLKNQPFASNITEDELNSFVDMWNNMVNHLAPRGEFVNGNKVRSIVADDVRIMLPDAKRNLLCMINEIKNWDKLPLAINVPLDEGNYWNWALIVVANRLLRSSYLRGQTLNAPMFTFDVKFFCYNIKKLANPYDECYLDR